MSRAAGLALLVVFGVLVTANSAGYRYGISDQAFYIPAIDLAGSPALFPRDRTLIAPQARLLVLDEGLAWVSRVTGLGLPVLFFAGYLATLTLFVAGLLLIGARLYGSAWTTAALVLALTLRHRILRTGVNTFEGYFHPRLLAFAVGLVAVGLFWSRRPRWAALLAAAAMLVHPTTGGWFVVWLGAAVFATGSPRVRRAMTAAIALTAAGLALALVVGQRLEQMDPTWMAAFANRDYLFPTRDWNLGAWVVNLLPAVVLAGALWWRARLGLLTRAETGIAAGALALLAGFLLSLPFIAAELALAVQLQTSRMLWPIELVATAYLVWMLAEAPWNRIAPCRRQVALVTLLAVASAARGYYVLRIEHTNTLARVSPAPSDWWRMGEWIGRHTPVDAHVLADPQHVWPYGTSLRIAARRDVVTEDTKDAAIALYGRSVALRVLDRRQALAGFHQLTVAQARALDRQYDLDYLLAERRLNLPIVHREGRLILYSLN